MENSRRVRRCIIRLQRDHGMVLGPTKVVEHYQATPSPPQDMKLKSHHTDEVEWEMNITREESG